MYSNVVFCIVRFHFYLFITCNFFYFQAASTAGFNASCIEPLCRLVNDQAIIVALKTHYSTLTGMVL